MRAVNEVQYLRGEIIPSDARLALKLMLSHEVYQMAMNFDEFKQLESSVRVSKLVLLQFLNFPSTDIRLQDFNLNI